MLELQIKGMDLFDEEKEEYIEVKSQCLVLEHSLISLHKWEQKWEVNYIDNDSITPEQFTDYVRCMTINKVNPYIYSCLTPNDIDVIQTYIHRRMTATKFRETNSIRPGRKTTAETIYAQMIALNIPFECAKWHLSSLLTLIRACAEENSPKKKMTSKESAQIQHDENIRRRKMYSARGR